MITIAVLLQPGRSSRRLTTPTMYRCSSSGLEAPILPCSYPVALMNETAGGLPASAAAQKSLRSYSLSG